MVRPFTPEDCDRVSSLRPQMLASGTHCLWHWWAVRYPNIIDPVVDAWLNNPYYAVTAWLPGASKRTVHEWIETLEMPRYVEKARAA